MIVIEVPGINDLQLCHLVLDYNGTLALDGEKIAGVSERIEILAKQVQIHVVTADTFGIAMQQLQGLPVSLHILEKGSETYQKQSYVERLGSDKTAAIGNGSNDTAMLEAAALGICVMGPEGCSSKAMAASDILVKSILEGMDLLSNPKRLTASLRE